MIVVRPVYPADPPIHDRVFIESEGSKFVVWRERTGDRPIRVSEPFTYRGHAERHALHYAGRAAERYRRSIAVDIPEEES